MKTKSVYSNGYELNEGGHAVKSTPIRNDMALRMINWLRNGIKSFTGLETASAGSAGKKHDDEFSGDIDIIVGSEPGKGISAIRGYITDAFGKGIETKESKGFNLLSCSLPFKDEKGNTSYVQVDFFFYSDIRMADFFYHSPDYRSENPSAFKGSVRNRLLSEIASAIPTGKKPIYFDSTDYVKEFWKYSYTPQGLMLKHKSFEGKKGHMNRNSHTIKEDTRKITSDPAAVVRFLLGEKATEKDTDSFESIISFMNSGNFGFPELKDKIYKNLVSGDDDPDERQRIEHFLTGKTDNRKLSESMNAKRKLQGSPDDYEDQRNKKIIKDTTDSILDAKYMVPEKVRSGFFEHEINVDFISDEIELVNELETDIQKSIDYKCEDTEKCIKDYPEFNPNCLLKTENSTNNQYSTNNQNNILNLTTLVFSRYYSNQQLFKFSINIWKLETYINSHRYVLIKCESQRIELYINSLQKLQKALSPSPEWMSTYHSIEIDNDPFLGVNPLNRKSYIQLIQWSRFFLSQEFYIFIYKIEHMKISQQLIKKLSDAHIHISGNDVYNYLLIQMICEEFPQIATSLIKANHISIDKIDEKNRKIALFLKDYFMKQIHGNQKDINAESVSESMDAKRKNQKSASVIDRDTQMVRKLSADIKFAKLDLGRLPENIDEFKQKSTEFINRLLKRNMTVQKKHNDFRISDYYRNITSINSITGISYEEFLFYPTGETKQELYLHYDINTMNGVPVYIGNLWITLMMTVEEEQRYGRRCDIKLKNMYFKQGEPLMTDDGISFMRYLYFIKTIYSKKFIDIMNRCNQSFTNEILLFWKKYTRHEKLASEYFSGLVIPSLFLYGLNHEFPDVFTFDNFIKIQRHYEIPFEQNFKIDKDASKFTYKYILESLKVQLQNIWHYWFSGEANDADREKFMKDNSVETAASDKSLLETFHYFNRQLSESMNAKRKMQGTADDYEKRRNKKIIKDTVNAIVNAGFRIPKKVINGFYNDIKNGISMYDDEKEQLITELENNILSSVGNVLKNKDSVKKFYSCTIERGKYSAIDFRTMTFSKFTKNNFKKPLYQFNIKLEEESEQLAAADNPMGRWITSWKYLLYNIVFEEIPLFIKQITVVPEDFKEIKIDNSQDWYKIPSINEDSYIQLISKARLLVSPEFYDFICKLMTVKISEEIIEKLKENNIRFRNGTCGDIIIRMICQKFPVFNLNDTGEDVHTRDSKWNKIEIFLKDYLLNQMYDNKETIQNDSDKIIVESMDAKIKSKKNLPDIQGTDAGTKFAIDLQLAKEGIHKIPQNVTEFLQYTQPLLKNTKFIISETKKNESGIGENFDTFNNIKNEINAAVYLNSDSKFRFPSYNYRIKIFDGIYGKSELYVFFQIESEIAYTAKDYVSYYLPFKAQFLDKPMYSSKNSYLYIIRFMKYMDNNKAFARIFQIFNNLKSQDAVFFKDYLYCHSKSKAYYDEHVLKYLLIYIINRTFPNVFTMDNFVKVQNDYANKEQPKGADIMNTLHDRFENIYKYWFSGKHDAELTYMEIVNNDFRKKPKINESMNAKRKMQGSADDYEKRRNKKIIKDTVTQLSPIAMDYRMLSEESLDEFTDYILQRYIKSNPYIKDFAKEDNPYDKDIKYININFKTQQNSCDYRIRMKIESLCLSWASDIMKSNDLNIEHTFNTPFRMEVCCFSDPTKSDNYIPKYDYLNSTDGTYSFKNPYEIIETINKHFLIDLELQLNLIRIAVCPSTVAVRHYYLTNDPGKITRMIVQNYVNIEKSSVIPLISGMLDGISFLLYMFPDNIRAKMVKGYLKNATNSNHLTEQSYNILFNEYEKYFAGYRKKIAGEFSTEFPLL